jgi:DNA-binding response OmpR family regulator
VPKILVIEDDGKTANAIRTGLRGEGYDAAVAKTGADGFFRLIADIENRRAKRGEHEVLLTPRQFDLLAYLARHQGQKVTRQMLAEDVWRQPHRATPLDNVIDVHVAHLRRQIDEGHQAKLIQTVRGVGFVLKEESQHE